MAHEYEEECDAFIRDLIEEDSWTAIVQRLTDLGIMPENHNYYLGDMKKYVFLFGNSQELYSDNELNFIDSVSDIIVSDTFYKEARKENIPCRSIVANLSSCEYQISAAVAFMKIMSKACDGFNIFFILISNALLVGCTVLGSKEKRNYTLADPIQSADDYLELEQNLIFAPEDGDFFKYYRYMYELFLPLEPVRETSYQRLDHIGSIYSYLETLEYIHKVLHININGEVRRVEESRSAKIEKRFGDLLDDIDSLLFEIKSSRVNTFEMLFDAEEAERQAIENERANEEIYEKNRSHYDTQIEISDRTRDLLSDPEELIKLLKEKKGLI